MFMVDTQGQATHYPHAVPLPLRVRTHSTAKRVLLGVMAALAVLYVIGVNAQAQAVPGPVPASAPAPCAAQGMTFNPCATLDPTQVQDRRMGAPTCVWDRQAEQWVTLPCHYISDTLDITIQHQP